MDPAKPVAEDVELDGAVADDDGVSKQAVVVEAADDGGLRGQPDSLDPGDADFDQEVGPAVLIIEDATLVRQQSQGRMEPNSPDTRQPTAFRPKCRRARPVMEGAPGQINPDPLFSGFEIDVRSILRIADLRNSEAGNDMTLPALTSMRLISTEASLYWAKSCYHA